jgi:predicted transcriptional regulator of viral defense system
MALAAHKPHAARLRGLASTFTRAQARRAGMSDRTLYQLRDAGVLEAIGRGLFRRTDDDEPIDLDMLEIAHRAPRATLCLTAALTRYGLTDEIPSTIDVALPRGQHRPSLSATVTWHLFDPATFDIGRTGVALDEQTTIGIYEPERSIVDAIRLRHREGPELGTIALKRWLTQPGSSPANLLAVARDFPQAEKALRTALDILL